MVSEMCIRARVAGRLHGLLVAPDDDTLTRLDRAVTERLASRPTGRPTEGDAR